MECMKELLNPVEPKDLGNTAWNLPDFSTQYNGWELPMPNAHTLQFQTDVINLVEGRVEPTSFDPEYRRQLENYYRFSAIRYPSKAPFVAKRIRDTFELV